MRTASVETCGLEIEFTLKPGKRREFTRSFEDLICHEGEGHNKTTVYEDRDEPGHMFLVAAWASRPALDLYLRSNRFGVLIGGLRVLSAIVHCRLFDDIRSRGSGAVFPGRVEGESRFTPVDLGEIEGPAQ